MMNPPGPKPPRRLLRLSIRALMLAVLVLAVALNYVVRRARVQGEAVAAIRASGGSVLYDWQRIPGKPIDPRAEPAWPRWLVGRLGVDYFGDVVVATLGRNPNDASLALAARFPRLVTIQITPTNDITDAGVAHLAGLGDLENLSLRGSKVTGAALTPLRGLTRLKILSLSDLPISDANLAHLGGLTRLERLDLSGTQVGDEGLAHLEGLVNLQTLNLGSTRITGPGLAHLRGMSRLKEVTLRRTKLKDLSCLPPLPGLKGLSLDETSVDDEQLAFLPSNAPSLEVLGLTGTNVGDVGLAHLEGLKVTLKGLRLGGTRVSDAGGHSLLALEDLANLQLGRTQVTDATLDRISGLKKLATFDVKGPPVTDEGLARLKNALPQLKTNQEQVAAMNAQDRASQAKAARRPPSNPGPQP